MCGVSGFSGRQLHALCTPVYDPNLIMESPALDSRQPAANARRIVLMLVCPDPPPHDRWRQ